MILRKIEGNIWTDTKVNLGVKIVYRKHLKKKKNQTYPEHDNRRTIKLL